MNSLNTQFGGSASNFQLDQGQNVQFGSYQGNQGNQGNQSNQGISEKQLDQFLCHLISALLQSSKNAEDGKGQGQGGDNGGSQGSQQNGPSPYTQMLMHIVGEILQAQNGGGAGGGGFGGGGFGGGG
ncbi:XopA/Hpa1 family type III secretion system protein, partial [Xanthomonas oryzae]|uniref:XopA/Hpa1 family type III secretion system protein n=1 Tax=Xanthomonas oryzae TaxID=347 RepID=UPI00036C0AD0